jgi:tetratricopeptide (TPR) repeat protein
VNTPNHTSSAVFFLLAAVIFIIYSNTLHTPWILDDTGNILNNEPLHLQQLSLQSLRNALFASPNNSEELYRPVACLSFALNWFVGQDNPFGYHIVNISIHILTAFFLYLSCRQLVNLTISPSIFRHHAHSVAIITALLWAINPMQTQAVTYIVQRMAALAALFSIIGIFFFIKARIAACLEQIIFFSTFCLFSFLLAFGSKENAILFPISLLLVEYIFFRPKTNVVLKIKKEKKKIIAAILLLCGGFLVFFYYYSDIIPSLNYERRTFTLQQRVLTSPRILLFYLSQLFFPVASRLSLEHDVVFSTSLFAPWTTLPALAGCLLLIAVGFAVRKKDQLLSFALLFYFLNHAVESTIIPLEPIFEHRNYLPSLFLFLPIAARAISLIERKKNNHIKTVVAIVITAALIFLGVNTYARNKAWATATTLWQDAYKKAPNSSRAAINLAKEYVYSGRIDEALSLAEHSYTLWQPTKNYAQALSLSGQGAVANLQGDNLKANHFFQKSLEFVPDYREARKNLILSLCKQHRFQEALMQFSQNYSDVHLEGVILLWMHQPRKALEKFRGAPEILEVENMAGIGKALSMIGSYEQADVYLRQAGRFSGLNKLIQIENLLRADMMKQAQILCQEMFSQYQAGVIFQSLSDENTLTIPLDRKLVAPFVIRQAKTIIPRIKNKQLATVKK